MLKLTLSKFTYGTKLKFIPDSCDNLPAEADGKITFCDAQGNLGIVEKSYGLAGNSVVKTVENYFNEDQVFIRQKAISILKENGTWYNIPRMAILSVIGVNNIATAQVEDAIVHPNGKLLLAVDGYTNEEVPFFDLVTLEFGAYDLPPSPNLTLFPPSLFCHDTSSGKTYFTVGEAGFGNSNLMSLDGEVITENGNLAATGFVGFEPQFLAAQNDLLFVGRNNNLYSVEVESMFIEQIQGDFTGDITGIDFATDGTLWFSNDDNNYNGIYALNTETDEIVEFNCTTNGNDFKFLDIVVDADGTVWSIAENSQNPSNNVILKLKLENENFIQFFSRKSLSLSQRPQIRK